MILMKIIQVRSKSRLDKIKTRRNKRKKRLKKIKIIRSLMRIHRRQTRNLWIQTKSSKRGWRIYLGKTWKTNLNNTKSSRDLATSKTQMVKFWNQCLLKKVSPRALLILCRAINLLLKIRMPKRRRLRRRMKANRTLLDQGRCTPSILFSHWGQLINSAQTTWLSLTSLTRREELIPSGTKFWPKRINSIKWLVRLEFCWISFLCLISTPSHKSYSSTFNTRHLCFMSSWKWFLSKVLESIPISMCTWSCARFYSRNSMILKTTRWISRSCWLRSVRNSFSRCLTRSVNKGKREEIL